MRFGYTILYVGDVEASVEFYERAFGLERRLLHDSGEYAELETGATALAFASRELAAENVPGLDAGTAGVEGCLVAEEVAGAVAQAGGAGGGPGRGAATKAWGRGGGD